LVDARRPLVPREENISDDQADGSHVAGDGPYPRVGVDYVDRLFTSVEPPYQIEKFATFALGIEYYPIAFGSDGGRSWTLDGKLGQ
jgi:hypothetical protein